MTEQDRPLRLVADSDGPEPSEAVAPAAPTADPLEELVRQIDDLPLDERPAAFERLNANLVAALNALEEV